MKKGVSIFSHTLPSLFYFNLPLALVLTFLFHGVVKQPLLQHLPQALSGKFQADPHFLWVKFFKKNLLRVVLSILLGASLHLAWDQITHLNADFFYEHQHQLFFFDAWKHHTFIYTLTHVLHSLIGLLVITWAIWQKPSYKTKTIRTKNHYFWGLVLFLTTAIFFFRLMVGSHLGAEDLAVSGMGAFIYGVLVSAVIFGNRNSRQAGP